MLTASEREQTDCKRSSQFAGGSGVLAPRLNGEAEQREIHEDLIVLGGDLPAPRAEALIGAGSGYYGAAVRDEPLSDFLDELGGKGRSQKQPPDEHFKL